jgi:hypothetical protein
MTDVMMDLETLSVRPDAVILIIGAVKFNRNYTYKEYISNKDLFKLNCFYKRITITSCLEQGLRKDPETEHWWNEQDEDIKYEAISHPDRVSLKQALSEFSKWYGNSKCIWGKGSSFDCTILGEAYKRCNMEIPWKFWLVRDLRTIMDLGNVKMSELPQYNKHHALWDCYRQIIGFQRSMKNL